MAKTPAALVVDHDIQARFEMKQVVKASGLTVAGESAYGMEAVTVANAVHPDIVVIGMNDPVERPLQTVESLAALLPDTPIIIYSDSKDIESARKAMLAGARDFLPRPVRPDVLRDSVLKSMEAEENRRLRKLGQVPAVRTQGTVITVFGAKGGIGKSTVATNLAVALAEQGLASVAIVDLDNGFGDVAGMLNLKPERTIGDLIRDQEKIDHDDLKKYLVKHEPSGLDVLAGPSILEWRQIPVDEVRHAVEFLALHYDHVVLDTSGSLTELSEMAVEIATIVLWVTTTEFASVKDTIEALRALKALSYSQDRIRIVMNAISPDDSVRPAALQEALQREVFWNIPYDRKLRAGTHLGQPIVVQGQSVAARSFRDLATVISGGRLDGSSRKILGGLKWRTGTQPAVAEGS